MKRSSLHENLLPVLQTAPESSLLAAVSGMAEGLTDEQIISNLGLHLARLETQVALTHALTQLPDLTLATGDPMVGPLQDNGGSTLTHALLTGSPAIDAGDDAVCAAAPINNVDQRGETRPVGENCDLGAVEGSDGGDVLFIYYLPIIYNEFSH